MTQLRGWTVVIAVMILAPAIVGASILQLLSRDGVSIPDVILTISAAAAAPSLALSLLWIAARPCIDVDRSSIPCLTAMPSPLPRVGIIMPVYKEDPEEVAHATLSLVLPAASYINGAVLMADGGLSIQNN